MSKATSSTHILVVNDTPQILDLFAELLGDAGYRVSLDRFTVEMDRLLATIKEQRPDLLILDLIVGNEGLGWQLLQLLKMDRTTRETPVVVCTAAVRQVEELQAHLDEMGVAVVLKPFDIDHLLAVVAGVLGSQATPETVRWTEPRPPRRS